MKEVIKMNEEILYVLILSLAFGYHFGVRKWLERAISHRVLKKYINYTISFSFLIILYVWAPSYFKLTLASLFSGTMGGYGGAYIYEYLQKKADLSNMKLHIQRQRLNGQYKHNGNSLEQDTKYLFNRDFGVQK